MGMLTMTVGIMGYCICSQFSGIHCTRTKAGLVQNLLLPTSS